MTTDYLLMQYLLIGMMFAANEFRMDYPLMVKALDEVLGPLADVYPPALKKTVMVLLFVLLTLWWPVALGCRLLGLLLQRLAR